MKFNIITLGCKVNTYESEYMKTLLQSANYEETNDLCDADLIIVNTCSVTNQSDNKSAKMIRHARRTNKNAILLVCGCSSEYKKEKLKDLNIDIQIGTKDKSKILEYIETFKTNHEPIVKFYDDFKEEFEDMSLNYFENKTRAFVKIQDGCNNFCSFCVIPLLRKNVRSKDFDTCLKEIKELTDNGFKEIVLTGIHTGSYNSMGHDMTDLIHEISKFDNLYRIRISSVEITELDDKFLNEFKVNKKICNHLHIPIQSGSDRILKLMNRKYTKEEFINRIDKLRSIRPDVNLTTDCLVGFPSETKEEFLECLDTINKIKFSKVHVFPYSKRDNTKASLMDNHVSEEEKKRRSHELITLSNHLNYQYNESFIGKTVNVLIEQSNKFSVGHTSEYLRVVVNQELETNKFYDVIIDKCDNDSVYGRVL